MKKTVQNRPAEVVSGLAIAGAVFGFLTQAGVPTMLAALVAVGLGFGPLAVSNTVDVLRRR